MSMVAQVPQPKGHSQGDYIMNEHLEPVFEVLLPELEGAEIEYWVYGGVSIAACVGRFIRKNEDVDIFVKDTDFESTRSILHDLCSRKNFTLELKTRPRPKLEVIDKREILSVVPVYLKDGVVQFRFKNGPAEYPYEILERVVRNVSGYSLFTPPDEYIRKLFATYLSFRPDVRNRKKTRIDAKEILTPDEFAHLYPQCE